MNKKKNFIKTAQILAPDDHIIHQAALRVSEDGLPTIPGGAGLEFVVATQRMRTPASACKARFRSFRGGSQKSDNTPAGQIELEDAIRVKSAELWLKLGQPDQALAELRSLPKSAHNHPGVVKVHLAVMRATRELNESPGV